MKNIFRIPIRVFALAIFIAVVLVAIFVMNRDFSKRPIALEDTPEPTPTLSLKRQVIKANNGWNTLIPEAGYFEEISFPDDFEVNIGFGFDKTMPGRESISFTLGHKKTDLGIGVNVKKESFNDIEDYLSYINFELTGDVEKYKIGNMPGYKVSIKNDFDQESLYYIVDNFGEGHVTISIGVYANNEKISAEDIQIAEEIISTFKM